MTERTQTPERAGPPGRGARLRALGPHATAVVAVVGLALAMQLRSPLLLKVRALGTVAAVALALLLLARAWRRGRRAAPTDARRPGGPLLADAVSATAALGVLIVVPALHAQKLGNERALAAADPGARARLGRHVVAGFRSWDEARWLVEQAAVGGLYIGLHNVRGLSEEALRERITGLVRLRRERGGPRLLIAADQEGGPVSRLSPPLPLPPPLSSVLEDAGAAGADEPDVRARRLGREQAAQLRALGVDVNFAPVVDLRLHPERGLLDRYSFIGSRAISADPEVTARIARAYAEGLVSGGVLPTLKHFPGLGRVQTDTHFFAARLTTPADELAATDFWPFRAVLQATPSLLMLGHAYVTAVDPRELASSSAPLVDGVVRRGWQHDGVLVTDDLCMSPPYYAEGGIGGSAVRALVAGIDLVLVSYDGSQVPAVLRALLAAYSEPGRALPESVLAASDARLDRMLARLEQALAAP
ncbi:MAG: glycoside hydrolase family 3 N-terminal domain-containing protein [Polyangia bacterium]